MASEAPDLWELAEKDTQAHITTFARHVGETFTISTCPNAFRISLGYQLSLELVQEMQSCNGSELSFCPAPWRTQDGQTMSKRRFYL